MSATSAARREAPGASQPSHRRHARHTEEAALTTPEGGDAVLVVKILHHVLPAEDRHDVFVRTSARHHQSPQRDVDVRRGCAPPPRARSRRFVGASDVVAHPHQRFDHVPTSGHRVERQPPRFLKVRSRHLPPIHLSMLPRHAGQHLRAVAKASAKNKPPPPTTPPTPQAGAPCVLLIRCMPPAPPQDTATDAFSQHHHRTSVESL